MKPNKKLVEMLALVEHGFKASTLMKLNEKQIEALHKRLSEQITTTQLPPMKVTKIPPATAKTTGANVGNVDISMDASGNVIAKGPVNSGKSDIKNKDKVISDTEMKEEMDFLKGKNKNEVKEKSVSKQQQKFFGVVRGMQKGDIPKKGEAGKAAKEMSKKDVKDFASTKHKGLPQKKETKENYMDMIGKAMNKNMLVNGVNKMVPGLNWTSAIEENIKEMVDKHITPKISKKDFIKYITETAKDSNTETAPTKPGTKEREKTKPKTTPNTPYKPKPGPEKAPKAKKKETNEDTKTAPAKPKTVPTTKPGTKPNPSTPYRPKPGPEKAPKAKKSDLPSWLSYGSIGLNIK